MTPTLTHATLATIDNCGHAARHTLRAYRAGGKRLVGAVDRALTERVYPRTAALMPWVTSRLDALRGNVSGLVTQGIDALAVGSDKAVELGRKAARSQVERVAGLAAAVDNPALARGLQTMASAALPGARIALALSGRLAERSDALASQLSGAAAKKAVRRGVRKVRTVRRRAA